MCHSLFHFEVVHLRLESAQLITDVLGLLLVGLTEGGREGGRVGVREGGRESG